MDFYFSFLKAYLMLIITFYRYSSAYAASHFHFNSRPPLLLLLPPTCFSLRDCLYIRQLLGAAASAEVNSSKSRVLCLAIKSATNVSLLYLLIGIDFLLSPLVFVSRRKPENVGFEKLFTFFSSPRLARRAPINFKFLLAFNLLNLFPNTTLCGEASLTHVDAFVDRIA